MMKTYFSAAAMMVAAAIMAGCGHVSAKAEGDEHDHEHEEAEAGHANVIHFTDEQAEACGLETETVAPGSFRSVLKASGEVESLQGDEQTIVATADGILNFQNASIAPGAVVSSGQTIATVSASSLQNGDAVLKAKLAAENAQQQYERAQKLVEDKIISEREFEQIKADYETAKAAYDGQAGNYSAGKMSIKVPMSGFIKCLDANQGDYVSVGQPIATVTKSRRLQLRADVPQSDYRYVKDIRSANFKTAYDDTVYSLSTMNGKVISYGRTAVGGSAFVPVTFEFDNVGDILPGSFAEIYLLSAERSGVLTAPLTAIIEDQGLFYVFIQDPDGDGDEYFRREVKLGQSDGVRTEILSGLNEGDVLVTVGAYQIKLASMSKAIPGHTHNH